MSKTTNNEAIKTSPYSMFETNAELERTGLKIDYGHFWFMVARAGGANTNFRDIYRRKTAPHKRALATETLPDSIAEKLSIETFAEATILGWGSEAYGDGVMPDKTGEPINYSTENVIKFFTDLPDLAKDLMAQSQDSTLFRKNIAIVDAKN